jgi:hypothetical protein
VADPLPADIRALVERCSDSITLTESESNKLFSYWRTTVSQWKAQNDAIEQLWKQHPEGTTQLVMAEREIRRPTHRLVRGDFLKPAEEIRPGTPAFLHPLETTAGEPTRLDFARWLVDRRSPTTARAIVNRIWQAYFGTGLVESSEDLGSQGSAPSHRELLDWLAVEFMENGWSRKWLHRQIVMSATYRQSSKATPEALAKDPANRWLARGVRFRMDAELVRDVTLAASGLLNQTVGGPSVYPPAPEFLFQPPASYGPKSWDYDTGSDKYRRGLYTFRFRSVPYPVLSVFDAPQGDASCTRRSRSNTPLQALATLNESLFVECARALALATVTAEASDDKARLTHAFRRCVTRAPSERELAILTDFLNAARAHFDNDQSHEQASKLVTATDGSGIVPPEGMSLAELGAWTATCRVILNLDETITKE